jgi:hypothetical protein
VPPRMRRDRWTTTGDYHFEQSKLRSGAPARVNTSFLSWQVTEYFTSFGRTYLRREGHRLVVGAGNRVGRRLPGSCRVGDASDASAPASTSNTTLIPKNAASPEPANDAMPTAKRLRHCEPVASRFADPVLGRIIGRCFV